MNCCSSRRRPPTCSRSSAVRRSPCKPACPTELAARLCEADIANIWLPGDPGFRLAASYQTVELNEAEYLSKIPLGPSRGSCVGRTLLEGRTVHIHDIRDDPEYELETSKLEGYRTMLGVPLLRKEHPLG